MSNHVFAQLLTDSQAGKLTLAISDTIAASFVSHPVRNQTHAELKRRFDICCKIVEHLRGDLKWSLPKIIDKIPYYLGDVLNGKSWTPDTKTYWINT